MVRCNAVALGAGLAVVLSALPACAQEPTGPSTPPEPTPSAASAVPAGPSHCAQTAGQTLGWGTPARRSDFAGSALPPDWHPYGPEPGHEERGTRTPDAITVGGGEATIKGTADGTTGAMSWHPGQRYGRWEVCIKSDRGGLHSVALLWPVGEDWPEGGEIDWMEISDDSRQDTGFFLHYGADNQQESGNVRRDATEWSAYALEWSPTTITAYVNGREWSSTTETSHFPPRPMNMTLQLDYFGDADTGAAMHIDWAAQWALPGSEPAQLSLAPGDPATGQPELHPERMPRKLGP